MRLTPYNGHDDYLVIGGQDHKVGQADNAWAKRYAPSRLASMVEAAPTMVSRDLEVNAQYKRLLQTDITNIEDLAPDAGAVLNPPAKKPLAVYRDDRGRATTMSAFCPHMKGAVCWNGTGKSFDWP